MQTDQNQLQPFFMLGDYPFPAAIHEKIAQSLVIETFDHGRVQPVTGQVSTEIRAHVRPSF
jgi:hypothetical protein